MNDPVAEIRAEVETHGWQVVLFPAEGPASAYGHTVGLSRAHAHPELIVVGLDDGAPDGVMHDLLESAAEFVAEGGRLEPGSLNHDLLEGHVIAVRDVTAHAAESLLGVAREVLGAPVDALQLVWPDRRGFLPWSPACEASVRARQPMLDAVG